MRVITVSEMKGRDAPHRDYPTPGSLADQIYQRLTSSKGKIVDLSDLRGKRSRDRWLAIGQLMDFYGLDIRKIHPRKHDALYVLAGEWFGSHYSDYVAAQHDGVAA